MLIAISGFPRSGSTFLYTFIIKLLNISSENCLGNFSAPINGCGDSKYIYDAIKTKNRKIAKIIPSKEFYDHKLVKTIVIERNFLDVAASAKQRWSGNWEENYKVINWIKDDFIPRYKFLIPFKKDKRLLWLDYEDCYKNNQFMADKISDFLEIERIILDESFSKDLLNHNLKISNSSWLEFSRYLRRKSVNLSQIIRKFLPKRYKNKRLLIWRKLNFIFPKNSKNNLVGPGHVSSFKGKPDSYKERLTNQEIDSIKKLFNYEIKNM